MRMKKKLDHLKNFLSKEVLPPLDPTLMPPSHCSSKEPLSDPHSSSPSSTERPSAHCHVGDSPASSHSSSSLLQRFWISCIFSIPLIVLSMGSHFIPFQWTKNVASHWVEFILSTPVVFWCGWSFFQQAWISIRTKHLNMYTLIGMGVGITYTYSCIATVFQYSLTKWFGHAFSLNVYFESFR